MLFLLRLPPLLYPCAGEFHMAQASRTRIIWKSQRNFLAGGSFIWAPTCTLKTNMKLENHPFFYRKIIWTSPWGFWVPAVRVSTLLATNPRTLGRSPDLPAVQCATSLPGLLAGDLEMEHSLRDPIRTLVIGKETTDHLLTVDVKMALSSFCLTFCRTPAVSNVRLLSRAKWSWQWQWWTMWQGHIRSPTLNAGWDGKNHLIFIDFHHLFRILSPYSKPTRKELYFPLQLLAGQCFEHLNALLHHHVLTEGWIRRPAVFFMRHF